MSILWFTLMAMLVRSGSGFLIYQDRIPNGASVPHPCHSSLTWTGVGHYRTAGGGMRNPFGRDFLAQGTRWTDILCRLDSDGDGLTNGQELGDPRCVWAVGQLPELAATSHPGICDPFDSGRCKESNKMLNCDTGEFACDAIHSPDVFNVTLRFPKVKVAAKASEFYCYTFELDMLEPGVDYHLIASKPYIDNPYVLHHLQLNGCGPYAQPMTKPETCNMAGASCQIYLSIWILGMPGECLPPNAGYLINTNKMKRLTMQLHHRNPDLREDYDDSSGLVLYLTKKLRRYNAGYWQTGQIHINIPPAVDRHVVTSTCSSQCTNKIVKSPVHIMTAWNHMHDLGSAGNIEHFRNGEKIINLTPDEVYTYSSPVIHKYSPAHTLLPGDSLKTTCVYRSTSKSVTTRFGELQTDEMCIGLVTFYPAENITHDSCYTWDDLELCNVENGQIYGCSYAMIFNETHPERVALVSKIVDSCNYFGGCRQECPQAIAEVRKHPCFNELVGPYMTDLLRGLRPNIDLVKMLAGLESCECPLERTTSNWNPPESSSSTCLNLNIFAAFLMTLTLILLQ